jgi:hypothetical protein
MTDTFYTSTLKKRRQGQRMSEKQRIEAQAAFLDAYEHTANVLKAAEVAGVDRTLVYYWLEHDAEFLFAYNLADSAANMHIEAEIHRRAIEGWEEPLVSAGKRVGTVRKYSDTLLIFYAKKRMPSYREKQQLDVTSYAAVQRDPALQSLTDEEVETLERISNRTNREG